MDYYKIIDDNNYKLNLGSLAVDKKYSSSIFLHIFFEYLKNENSLFEKKDNLQFANTFRASFNDLDIDSLDCDEDIKKAIKETFENKQEGYISDKKQLFFESLRQDKRRELTNILHGIQTLKAKEMENMNSIDRELLDNKIESILDYLPYFDDDSFFVEKKNAIFDMILDILSVEKRKVFFKLVEKVVYFSYMYSISQIVYKEIFKPIFEINFYSKKMEDSKDSVEKEEFNAKIQLCKKKLDNSKNILAENESLEKYNDDIKVYKDFCQFVDKNKDFKSDICDMKDKDIDEKLDSILKSIQQDSSKINDEDLLRYYKKFLYDMHLKSNDMYKLANESWDKNARKKLFYFESNLSAFEFKEQLFYLLKNNSYELDNELLMNMARQEHERWNRLYIANGWRVNTTKNEQIHQHNCLVPYGDCSEGITVGEEKIQLKYDVLKYDYNNVISNLFRKILVLLDNEN